MTNDLGILSLDNPEWNRLDSLNRISEATHAVDTILTEAWQLFTDPTTADIQVAVMDKMETIRAALAALEGEMQTNAIISLAEAERRWRKTNLRQNSEDFPRRFRTGREWMTTTLEMTRCYGPAPEDVWPA